MRWRKWLDWLGRWFLRPVMALLLLALLLSGLATALLVTERGNVWLVQRVAAWLPGELEVSGWQGNLVQGLTLAQLRYAQNGLVVELEGLEWQPDLPHWWYGRLQWQRLAAQSLTITLPASADDNKTAPFVLPASLALPLAMGVDEFELGRLVVTGDNPVQLGPVQASDVWAWRSARIGQLSLTAGATQLNAFVGVRLSYPYPLTARVEWQHTLPDAPLLQGQLVVSGDVQQLRVAHDLQSPVHIRSDGVVRHQPDAVALAAWAFDLEHQWQAQPLPLDWAVPVQLGKGRLHTQGGVQQVSIEGDSALLVAGKSLTVALQADMTPQQAEVQQLDIRQAKQHVQLRGQVDYQQGVQWQLEASGEHLDPALLVPDWPGDLALQLSSKGHWRGGKDVQLTLSPLRLTGPLDGRALSVAAVAAPVGGNTHQLDVEAQWGADQLTATGELGDALAMRGKARLTDLGAWLASAAGEATLSWQLGGNWSVPQLSGQLQATQLVWQDWRLAQLQADATTLNRGDKAMQLRVQADQLHWQGKPQLTQANLELEGTLAQHQLALQLQQAEARTRLQAEASLTQDWQWQGKLSHWTFEQPEAGVWHLQQPVPFEVSSQRQQLQSLCLLALTGMGKICVQGQQQNGQIKAQTLVQQMPLALANIWLREHIRASGWLDASAQVSGAWPQLQGDWQMALQQAVVTLSGEDDAEWLFEFAEAAYEGTLQQQRLAQQLAVTIKDKGSMRLALETGLTRQQPLTGQVAVEVPDLGVFAPFVPWLEGLQGQLAGQLQLGGSPLQPQAEGQLALTDAGFTLPEWGISLTDTRLDVVGEAQRIRLQGQASVGNGQLQLNGEWQPHTSPLAFWLKATGQRLKVVDNDDATVFVSPDLRLSGDGKTVQLTGDLHVPDVRLEPHQLPESAVTVSADQVFVDDKEDGHDKLPFAMKLDVTLGDKVNIKGFGLTARLTGELDVRQQPLQPAQLYGDLTVVEGRFRAYGQNLAVDNGRLLFQGPADDPGLDVRAIRKIPQENLVVGVRVTGTLRQPRAEVFAEPPLEESQAMSYLLTGRGLNQGNDSDYAKIARALAVYGLQKGESVSQKVGDTLGIDEISIGSEWGDADDAALMLSKQLSDRLFLTYAVGLFDAVSTVMFRYILSRTLHLEAHTSNQSQALDLIWTKELD